MNNIQETFTDYFNKLYKMDGYLDKYGGSVVVSAVTFTHFFSSFFLLLCSITNRTYTTGLE